LPDIIPDVVLLLLLSPNESDYVFPEKDDEYDQDYEEGELTPRILSVNHTPSNDGSLIDQDEDDRRVKKPHRQSAHSFHSTDDEVTGYQKETSTLLGSSESDQHSRETGSRTNSTNSVGSNKGTTNGHQSNSSRTSSSHQVSYQATHQQQQQQQ